MPELCTPALHSLLPDVLSSLSKVFDLVECEMASCPNVSEAPHNLPVSSLGQQIYVIPEKVKIIDANTYLDGAKLVATTEGYHIISDGKSNYTLRIGLQDSSGDWRKCIIDCMTQKYGDKWEFLCLEQISEKSSLHLLRLGKDYVIKEHRSVINGSYYSVRENCTIWLIPVTKVVNEEQNGVVKNGEVNGVEETKPKTIIKKKIIKKVVKKKDPNADPPKENGSTSLTENGEDKPKKTLVSTKTEKTETGTKVVKKKIVDKSTPKENSPEVVQEVVEDISNAAYIVKLGQIPAPDGKSLADEKNEEIKQNGAFEKDSSEERKCILDTARKFDNVVQNGIPSSKELETNGVDSIILNGKPKESTKPTEFSYGRVSATRPLVNGDSLNLVNGQNKDNENEQSGENPRDRTSFRASRTESTDKSEVSTLSEATSTLSQESKYESPLSPTIRLDPLSSDDEISYSSARSGRTSSSTIKNDTDYEPQRTGVLSGFLSSLTSGLGFRRSPSPTTSSGMHETSSRLRNGMLPPISESGSRISENGSRNSISGHVNGLHRDKFDRGFSASPLTLSRSQSNTRAGSIGSRFTPPKDEPRVQGMPQMPVIVLQQVLKQFSYKELNQIRRVHPHWDEICGQLLNTGYYELIDRASIMMMDCQRRVHVDKRLERPLKVLTNLQVHVLNPVDILRAPMDEGVICFPYGKILDQSFALLETIEKIIKGMPGFEDPNMIDLPWEPLADWARRAQVHYRRCVEPEVDKRLNEAQKLSAVHRQLQRLDSFLVETNVTRLEKITDKTRDELHWEIEQLKSQNQQLKKDNRELKQNQQKLDARVDALERKFKTVARLLQ